MVQARLARQGRLGRLAPAELEILGRLALLGLLAPPEQVARSAGRLARLAQPEILARLARLVLLAQAILVRLARLGQQEQLAQPEQQVLLARA